MGIDLSLARLFLLVIGRSLTAMAGGFLLGYAIKHGFDAENNDSVTKLLSITAMALIVSLLFYRFL